MLGNGSGEAGAGKAGSAAGQVALHQAKKSQTKVRQREVRTGHLGTTLPPKDYGQTDGTTPNAGSAQKLMPRRAA